MHRLAPLLILLALSACSAGDARPDTDFRPEEARAAVPDPRHDLDLARSATFADFGQRLFGAIVAAEPEENIFVSPTSAAQALALVYNGAAAETQKEMAAVLGLEGRPLEEINRAAEAWREAILDQRSVELSIANSIWARDGVQFDTAFMRRNVMHYRAGIAVVDFNDPATVDLINHWAARSTRGRISKIVGPTLREDLVLILANALYFKGAWSGPFEKQETQDRPFTTASGAEEVVPMMSKLGDYAFADAGTFQILRLPYRGERFSMYVLLPDRDSNLAALYREVAGTGWEAWIDQMDIVEVDVRLPRFKLEYQVGLVKPLVKLGMREAFTSSADFGPMFHRDGQRAVFIGDAFQKTFLEVNEQGTEAAAVTVVMSAEVEVPPPPPPPVEFYIDRPFFFTIRDDETGTVLFMGQITNPAHAGA